MSHAIHCSGKIGLNGQAVFGPYNVRGIALSDGV